MHARLRKPVRERIPSDTVSLAVVTQRGEELGHASPTGDDDVGGQLGERLEREAALVEPRVRDRQPRLVHLDLPCLDAEVRPYFRDVFDHVRRVEANVESLREVLTTVFEVSNLLEQQRQSAITRQLAAWAAILAVPTAIAGIYGMNFEHMPELETQNGYFVVLGVIVTLCIGLYMRFKAVKWL